MRGLRCEHCHRIIRADVEPIFYRMAGETSDENTIPVGLHKGCEAAYNGDEIEPTFGALEKTHPLACERKRAKWRVAKRRAARQL